MLSRIAESLYWIGRYVERADDTCRMLSVHLQLMVDDPASDTEASATALLRVLGMSDVEHPVTPLQLIEIVNHDPASPCSVRASVNGARESARRARETVPPELWEAINTTWHAVSADSFRRMRPTAGLAQVRERCAFISGTADTTMSHDDGWMFLQLGRSVERIDMTARLMLWATAAGDSSAAWNNALHGSGAMHSFRRKHGAAMVDRDAAEFMLLDRLFPRSVVHSLAAAENALAGLEPEARRIGFAGDAVRLVGRTRAELEYQTIAEVLSDLPDRLAQLLRICTSVDGAIATRYFTGAPSPSWSGGAI